MRDRALYYCYYYWILVLLSLALSLSSHVCDGALPLGDINIVVVTDVHSWLAGHSSHEDDLNADYGDVLSFYQNLQLICEKRRQELFFVMNGDFLDGTGLSSIHPANNLMSLIEKMPFDAVNVGNHEMYHKEDIDALSKSGGFVDHWQGGYLTTNVLLTETGANLGSKYKFLQGKYGGTTILTFGFLYNMINEDSAVTVRRVQTVLQEAWFLDVLQTKMGNFDAILVLAHMDFQHPLVDVILNAIRDECGDKMPVQFITGHTHIRGHSSPDIMSSSLEAGRYLDTVGFASFSRQGYFQHVFLDANVKTLVDALNMGSDLGTITISSFKTTDGQELTDAILETQNAMGLLNIVACSPQSYYLERTVDHPDSLWGLYLNTIVPHTLFEQNSTKIMIHSGGDFRYDLFQGDVTVTDLVSVSPYTDDFYLVAEMIEGFLISTLLLSLNAKGGDNIMNPIESIPDYLASGDDGKGIKQVKHYDVYTTKFNVKEVKEYLERLTDERLNPAVVYPSLNPHALWFKYVSENWLCNAVLSKHTTTKTSSQVKVQRLFLAILLFVVAGVSFTAMVFRYSPRARDDVILSTAMDQHDEDNVLVTIPPNFDLKEDFTDIHLDELKMSESPSSNVVV